jgi:hypothetical protein
MNSASTKQQLRESGLQDTDTSGRLTWGSVEGSSRRSRPYADGKIANGVGRLWIKRPCSPHRCTLALKLHGALNQPASIKKPA